VDGLTAPIGLAEQLNDGATDGVQIIGIELQRGAAVALG
jgi:hypothetical protein